MASTISGIVLDAAGGFPHPGLHVVVGTQRTTTDSDGKFTLNGVPKMYDLVLLNEQRSRVHVYSELTRRELVLVFGRGRARTDAAHHARLSGTLSGGGEYPLSDALHVHFRGAYAGADEMLGGMNARDKAGPSFGPLELAWDGPTSFTGDLVSRRTDATLRQAYCARTSLQVNDGRQETVRLEFEEVPLLERAAIRFSAPSGVFGTPQLRDEYHPPGLGMVLHGNQVSDVHAYRVADLHPCGLTLCTLGWIANPYFNASTVVCGAASAEAATITLHDAPKVATPAPKSRIAPGETFTWSAVPDAVYALHLSHYSLAEKPSAAAPTIVVYTSKSTAVWPDSNALEIAFPKPFSVYTATVKALGPYADLDRALGPEGLGWGTPEEAWNTDSAPLPLFVEQPAESKCEYSKPRPIACSEATGPTQHFDLTSINDKLRHYPALANTIGLHCVQDCAAARAFTRAYETYLATHPDFDADESLLEPDEEPPPPF